MYNIHHFNIIYKFISIKWKKVKRSILYLQIKLAILTAPQTNQFQGTTSTRVLIVDHQLTVLAISQKQHKQITSHPGWVEHDPDQIFQNICLCIKQSLNKANLKLQQIKGIGVTNQRQTTVAFRRDGTHIHNAIVWLDTRTAHLVSDIVQKELKGDSNALRKLGGLPVNTYFSGVKMRWLIENVPAVKEQLEKDNCLFGTMDTYIVYRATKGKNFVTDVTNASRTLLMNLQTLQWDEQLLKAFKIPSTKVLANILPCASNFGAFQFLQPKTPVKISGILGDQQAACLGHLLKPGQAKNTYGTGCFMLINTGEKPDFSNTQLLTTLCYKLSKDSPTLYALEGAVQTAGAAVTWARDNMGLFKSYSQIHPLLEQVKDSGGVVFVPAFSGLFSPYWRPDAKGLIIGITQHTNKSHILRSIFQAVCFRTKQVLDSVRKNQQVKLMKVDGGMTQEQFLLQNQADLLGIPVQTKIQGSQVTAIGAAIAAGIEVGVWKGIQQIQELVKVGKSYTPRKELLELMMKKQKRWKNAVQRCFNWPDLDQ